ncbi:hypothetical protein A3D81_00060 [Candidatus Curtissbacteria bacterium RIFCSPHIGHO2_02_FULL_40_17]|uniref:Uncharacterized protein n=4 Tax=Candidatus Curtissiibacteriota TaxID=1752717 RepID=A0A1F5GGK3_9BACT|nr:MAG: hypothetical protein A2693_00695 [Candidatus Curtissbacteria bacterium RIFCSPHIGHO2_01_FULL_40_12]OGD90980.1 MAG: hypothetical protein A3D81_00060 [Candidatus Curtissbacteria bacterium RIFCSPHIGHO2_02_FULL_40_17]OGE05166.1 MAG: hypothetical protein A3F45_01685 [Candidatus Curtissbacteria bacterium RIFCSPHIGHO2_12_FULL_41_17]OGE07772.1 MAG: hypothetical protein A3I53_02125 [Candidatus Curtissbacteria bacterium RIFCSPLOWO2_02_FULL_40_13b]
MDPISKEKTLERLTKAQSVSIIISDNSGFDGLASGLGLYLSLTKIGKNISVYAKHPTVSDASKLYAVDKIGRSGEGKNLVINIDNAVNTVDKVTYFLNHDKLKIVIHPLTGTNGASTEQISFEHAPSKSDLRFVIGFKTAEELNKEFVHEQTFSSDSWTVSISLEEMNQKFAHASVGNPQATSLSELTANLLRDLALPLDEDTAYNLYTGIAHSTNNFDVAKSTPATLEIASWLIKFGAGRASFAQKSQPAYETPLSSPVGSFPATSDSFKQVDEVSIDQVEFEKSQKEWLKPPKIYKGSKSFDTEH